MGLSLLFSGSGCEQKESDAIARFLQIHVVS
jgi:hypothetical protein